MLVTSNNQLQDMITYVKRNQPAAFFEELEKINDSDKRAIKRVIDEGWYEEFDRYDSDVCEEFIRIYEATCEGR